MYICDTCGARCDFPATYREYYGFNGDYVDRFIDCECGGEWEKENTLPDLCHMLVDAAKQKLK